MKASRTSCEENGKSAQKMANIDEDGQKENEVVEENEERKGRGGLIRRYIQRELHESQGEELVASSQI